MAKFIPPCEVGNLNWSEVESSAFQILISDYCISSKDCTISCGYLNGLESLVGQAGLGLVTAKSCKIISLANLGKKAASPVLSQKAETLYFELLPSFRWNISNERKSTTMHSFMTAVLLGLYEVSIACGQDISALFDVNRSLQVRVPNWVRM